MTKAVGFKSEGIAVLTAAGVQSDAKKLRDIAELCDSWYTTNLGNAAEQEFEGNAEAVAFGNDEGTHELIAAIEYILKEGEIGEQSRES